MDLVYDVNEMRLFRSSNKTIDIELNSYFLIPNQEFCRNWVNNIKNPSFLLDILRPENYLEMTKTINEFLGYELINVDFRYYIMEYFITNTTKPRSIKHPNVIDVYNLINLIYFIYLKLVNKTNEKDINASIAVNLTKKWAFHPELIKYIFKLAIVDHENPNKRYLYCWESMGEDNYLVYEFYTDTKDSKCDINLYIIMKSENVWNVSEVYPVNLSQVKLHKRRIIRSDKGGSRTFIELHTKKQISLVNSSLIQKLEKVTRAEYKTTEKLLNEICQGRKDIKEADCFIHKIDKQQKHRCDLCMMLEDKIGTNLREHYKRIYNVRYDKLKAASTLDERKQILIAGIGKMKNIDENEMKRLKNTVELLFE